MKPPSPIVTALATWLACGSGEDLYVVDRTTDPPRVSADVDAVGADAALVELGRAMEWEVVFETTRLRNDLALVSVDLSFDLQDPRIIADLIAVAGRADVTFDDRSVAGKTRTVLHVVKPPSEATEAGRRRLRRRAMQWYRMFLGEELRDDPLVAEHAVDVRLRLAQMMLEQGDLEGAIRAFEELKDQERGHRYLPLALVRLAQCHYRLGDYRAAERYARELSRMHPSRPETAAAVVLLGRILLDTERYDECVREMRSHVLPLAGTPEIVDIFLIAARAQRRRGRPDEVFRQTELLASSPQLEHMSPQQWLEYWFLRGAGAEGIGKHREAMLALEAFLGSSPADDPRRGEAFVLLGRAYLALGKFVEARAASLEARALEAKLDPRWRTEARILEAKARLAIGEVDRAFAELEVEVRRNPRRNRELILFLVETLIEEGRYQKAITNADLLAEERGIWGDRARLSRIRAMAARAERSGIWEGFPRAATAIAARIEDLELQRQAAELIGRGYERLGDMGRAADAYRGLLR